MKKEIIKFLNLANKSTYANKDMPKSPSSKLMSEDYIFEKGNHIYHDTYWTSKTAKTFIGSEIIYENKVHIWGANYFGVVIDKKIKPKEVYAFLREALMQADNSNTPVRGVKSYKNKDWKYTFTIKGDIGCFVGIEKIYYKGILVYKLDINGGFLE